jgi:hypothetical protein
MLLVAAALAGASGSALAESTGIMIVDEHYSTTNKVTYNDPWHCAQSPYCTPTTTTVTTQQTSSSTPLETELHSEGFDLAKSTAGTFSVAADAYGWAHATAETSFTFRVLQDTSTLLTFEGALTSWSWGSFSLLDQTAGTSLFSQAFGFPGYAGPNPVWGDNIASVSFSGLLESDHLYKLTLRGDADDQYDGGWRMSLGVNGLHAIAAPVPEPEAWAMMLAGLVAVGSLARRRSLARPT